jgi:hypothetical protein
LVNITLGEGGGILFICFSKWSVLQKASESSCCEIDDFQLNWVAKIPVPPTVTRQTINSAVGKPESQSMFVNAALWIESIPGYG